MTDTPLIDQIMTKIAILTDLYYKAGMCRCMEVKGHDDYLEKAFPVESELVATFQELTAAELERGKNPASQEFYDIAYRDGVRGGLSYAADLMGGEGEDAARRMLFAEAAKYDNQRAASVKGIKDEGWDAFYQLRKQVADGVYGDRLKNQVIAMEVKESS